MSQHSIQTAPRPNPGAGQRSGRLIPWIFVASFAVVAAVNGVMIAYAVNTFTGLTTDRAYEDGLAYNQTLAAARAQERLGWKAGVDFAATDRDHARVIVTLHGGDGAPLDGATLSARFIRPTSQGADTEVPLNETGAGRYEAQLGLALPGQWDIVILASHDGASYQTSRRVFVPR